MAHLFTFVILPYQELNSCFCINSSIKHLFLTENSVLLFQTVTDARNLSFTMFSDVWLNGNDIGNQIYEMFSDQNKINCTRNEKFKSTSLLSDVSGH